MKFNVTLQGIIKRCNWWCLVSGRARLTLRQRAGIRRRPANSGAISCPQADEYFLRARASLGRWTISNQLYQLGTLIHSPYYLDTRVNLYFGKFPNFRALFAFSGGVWSNLRKCRRWCNVNILVSVLAMYVPNGGYWRKISDTYAKIYDCQNV